MNDTLGLWLRRAREARQLGLPDAEKALRIRQRYLQALEMGDYAALPGEIQTRGFLRNYARYLRLPVEDVLARYDAEVLGRPLQPRRAPTPETVRPLGRERTWAPPPPGDDEVVDPVGTVPGELITLLIIGLVFFGLLAVGSFVALRLTSTSAEATPAPATPALSANVAATNTPAATTPLFQPSADGQVRLALVARQSAWVSVSADDRVVYRGFVEADQVLEASAQQVLSVETGNAGAFLLYLNGVDWGSLGAQGEVVRRAWTPQGETSLGDS